MAVRETCSICQFPVEADEDRTQCPHCGLPFHAECWQQNYGCSAYGCPQVSALKPAAPPGDAAGPPTPQRAPVPAAEPFPWEYLLLGASALGVLASLFTYGIPSAVLLVLIGGQRLFRRRTSRAVFVLSVLVCLAGVIGGATAAHYLGMWPMAHK